MLSGHSALTRSFWDLKTKYWDLKTKELKNMF
ncbi:hypothetical protein HDEF_1357 [Candidatus Hamiltonella defensa 5AT (Acyrthosiphon pisum)]|uniref:Uncharacterized protein n=1 Tax=Hamiltonella defensa subsp. Acyrthosiphon pisum (strain 5AT) TaxID=572265 RepID=C4K605_HAMD5|nr:hypothetical protein HDEF_1357 [Candidatus Hamiltonella defensa 5AT (Acyrthosiphon pisum)]